ncbi:MAG: hypothetical protein WCJ33_07345 [Pseudomonadota bacterium]
MREIIYKNQCLYFLQKPSPRPSPEGRGSFAITSDNNIIICDLSEKYDAFAAANLALSKSGTVTLELAFANVPTVVAHKVNKISAWLIRKMLLIKYASLVNIATNREIMPELIQEKCNADDISQALLKLKNPAEMQKQIEGYKEAIDILKGSNKEHPNDIAARIVLGFL